MLIFCLLLPLSCLQYPTLAQCKRLVLFQQAVVDEATCSLQCVVTHGLCFCNFFIRLGALPEFQYRGNSWVNAFLGFGFRASDLEFGVQVLRFRDEGSRMLG